MPDLEAVALTLVFVLVFAVGASVGSFLNVCAFRLPYERSFFWPGSRCGHCFQPVKWYDNVPLLSYWLLRGRCRTCDARFSMRYFFVELGTGLAFVGLFYLEIYRNALRLPELANHTWGIQRGFIPPVAMKVFVYHATLMSFLIVASLCDIDHLEIPLGVTVSGTILGLIGATWFPWPYPSERESRPAPAMEIQGLPPNPSPPQSGLYPWPVWYPLPHWMPPGSWQLGLLTGLAGAAAGTMVLRAVRLLFSVGRGIDGLGIGDADLMMMAGSFLGWQAILAAFVAGVFPALFFGIVQIVRRGQQMLPFGPSLAIGVMLALLGWPHLAPRIWPLLSEPLVLLFLGVFCPVSLLAVSFLLRLLHGNEPAEGSAAP